MVLARVWKHCHTNQRRT